MTVSVIICTYRPAEEAYRRTLAALAGQSLARSDWELIIVDNNSPTPSRCHEQFLPGLAPRLFREMQPGQANARRLGLREARGQLIIFVDQDNVLHPDYLAEVVSLFARHPEVGLAGGKSLPEFEVDPPPWTREFWPLLALRDHGDVPVIVRELRPAGTDRNQYPLEAPHGAGMAGRKAAFDAWLAQSQGEFSGRRFNAMTSGDDNDIVLWAMRNGWAVAYFPSLVLTHLIPPERLTPAYLARINHGIQLSWMQLLHHHQANPWPPLTPWGARLRKTKAWLTYRAWAGHAEYIRWRGACGHFEGRLPADPSQPRTA